MSELTRCNFCNLKAIRERAKAAGSVVTVMKDARWGLDGSNVYVHPPSVNVRKMVGGEDGLRKKYRVAWMMGIGGRCEC